MNSPALDQLIDPAAPGTAEARWRAAIERHRLEPLDLGRFRPQGRAVVVSPHPDDEVLGAGGVIRHLVRSGRRVDVLAVTDGEAAFGVPDPALARERKREVLVALDRVCADLPPVRHRPGLWRLGLPDGDVAGHARALEGALAARLTGALCCVSPWPADGHPDHEATGRVVERVAAACGVPLLRYPVWLWHWGDPDGALPWDRCRRLDLDDADRRAKRWALAAFTSQTRPTTGAAILTPAVLDHFQRDTEVFVT